MGTVDMGTIDTLCALIMYNIQCILYIVYSTTDIIPVALEVLLLF